MWIWCLPKCKIYSAHGVTFNNYSTDPKILKPPKNHTQFLYGWTKRWMMQFTDPWEVQALNAFSMMHMSICHTVYFYNLGAFKTGGKMIDIFMELSSTVKCDILWMSHISTLETSQYHYHHYGDKLRQWFSAGLAALSIKNGIGIGQCSVFGL